MPIGGICGPDVPAPPKLSKELLAAIKASHAVAKAESDAAHDQMKVEMVEDAKKQIALIPEHIARAIVEDQDYVRLFELLHYTQWKAPEYGLEWPKNLMMRSWAWGYFKFPRWLDWKFAKKPKREWLDGMSRLVWDYCQENGLQPFFEPFRIYKGGKRSAMFIRFEPAHIEKLLAALPDPEVK